MSTKGARENGAPYVSGFREHASAQSPGKSYRVADVFSRSRNDGIWAEWEAGFRLTGTGKPATDGVSGLFCAVVLPSVDSHDRTDPETDNPVPPVAIPRRLEEPTAM